MKKIIYAVLTLAAFSITFSNCKKDNPSPDNLAKSGTMAASLDGTSFNSFISVAAVANGTIEVGAANLEGLGIAISIPKSAVAGMYDVRGASATIPDAIIGITPDGEEEYSSTYYADGVKVGLVTITAIDAINKTISGTFSAKVKRFIPVEKEINITNGSFTKIPYSTTTSTNSTNAFSAKIDGTAMTAVLIGGIHSNGTITLSFSTSGSAQNMIIVIPETTTTGDHDLGNISDAAPYYALYSENSTNTWASTGGVVTITKFDATRRHVEGSFHFPAAPFPGGGASRSVTDGSFVVTYY